MDDYPESTTSALAGSSEEPWRNASSISEEDELKMLNFPSKREDLSTAIPLTVIFALLLVTGCIGNLCTAIVIARPKNKYMHTATNYYLFSLAMSDFLFLILGLPQEMYTLWQRYPYAFGESFCIIRGYLSEASTYASILTISAFTMERYVAICHPLWAHTMSQLPRAITSILIIWIVSAICAIPPAAELGIITQKGPLTNRTLEESAQCATKRTIYENMFAVSAIVFFIVPMIIVTVLYILIALELRRSSKMNSAISKQTSSGHHHHHHHHHHHNHHHHHHHLSSSSHNNHRKHHYQHHNHQQVMLPQHSQSSVASGGHLFAAAQRHRRQESRANLSLVQQQPHLAGTGSGKGELSAGNSLMANIMSQRPSSAIGTEQQPALPLLTVEAGSTCTMSGRDSGCSPKRQASLWPLGLFGPPAGCACGRPAAKLVASNSLQPHGPARGQPPADTPDSLCRAHSPLSYHESLIGQRPASAAHSCPPSAPALLPAKHCRHDHPHGQPPTRGHAHPRANGIAAHSAGRRSVAASSKKSVIRMLVAVVVSFFICWVPFHAQRLMASYLVKDENRNQLLLDTYLKLTYISGVMYYLSSTINPLLYQLMSAKFRLAFKETFNCSLLKCAFFSRRSSSSPSNSLKEHHLRRATCECPTCLSSQLDDCAGAATSSTWACSPPSCAAAQQHQQQVGVMARLRGRLHSSLVSLFRLGSAEEACPYCPPQVGPAAGGGRTQSGAPARQSNSCVSTPLLMEPPVNATDSSRPAGAFPAHSVLKFVRAPTPLCPAVQPQCLTRLSSREEEEPGADKRQDGPDVGPMDALIRATDEREEAHAHSLIIMTSESGASSSSSSPEQAAAQRRLERDSGPVRPGLEPDGGCLSVAAARAHRRRLSTQNTPTGQSARRKSSSSSATAPSATTCIEAPHPRKLSAQSSQFSSDRQLDKKLSISTTTSAIDCGSYTTTNSQLTRTDSAHLAALSREHSSEEGSSEPSTTVISLEPQEPQLKVSPERRPLNGEADLKSSDSQQQLSCR